MRERPILFSAPMVRAILAGQKTQTRRIMTKQPGDDTTVHVERFNQTVVDRHGDEQPGPEVFGAWWDDGESGLKCPYGGPGDRLWVRETWAAVHYEDDNCWGSVGIPHKDDAALWDLEYRATHPLANDDKSDRGWSWKPAIHMPRWASRITLEITGVRVERLNAISEIDAKAEGAREVHWDINTGPLGGYGWGFRRIWESINGVGSWEVNPWVWVVEFKRLEA